MFTKKQATEIVGGLSKPGKMPGKAWGIPADRCVMGSKLSKSINAPCHKKNCYAKNGRNHCPSVIAAQERRLSLWGSDDWIEAMVTLIKGDECFRWFDTGDLQHQDMLASINFVAYETPDTLHWLPTQEWDMVDLFQDKIAPNLVIRKSSRRIDMTPPVSPASMVYRERWPEEADVCQAQLNKGECGDCRKCWDRNVPLIAYPYHRGAYHVSCIEELFLCQ